MIPRTSWSEFIFALVLAAVALVTITTLAAMPKGPPISWPRRSGRFSSPSFKDCTEHAEGSAAREASPGGRCIESRAAISATSGIG